MSDATTDTSTSTELPTPGDAPELHDTLGVNVHSPDGHTDADPQRAIEEIQRPQTYDPGAWDTPSYDEGALPKPIPPSFGEEKPSCGEDTPFFCAGCGKVHAVGDTCQRLSCPRCAEAGIRERAREICSRLAALRAMLDARRDPHQRFHHVVVSPPKEWILLADKVYKRTVDVVKELFKIMGLVGWYAFHPWAGEDGDDRGAWKHRLLNNRDWEDVKDELIHRPHFHAVVVTHKVPGGDFTREIEDETGWIIARITPDDDYHDDDLVESDDLHGVDLDDDQDSGPRSDWSSNVSIYGNDELARVVTYILSHTGLEEKETNRGTEHHLMANYIGTAWDYDDQEPKWWPEVVDVQDGRKDEWDAIVRAAAPTTLGAAADHVMCSAQHLPDDAPDHDYHQVDVVGSAARSQGNSANLLYLPDERRTTLPKTANHDGAAGAGSSADAELDDQDDVPTDLEAAADGATSEYDEPEPETCRGRLLHIAKAHRYLDDPEWLENAADPISVLTAYEKWTDQHPDALDNVDTQEVVERAERRLGVS